MIIKQVLIGDIKPFENNPRINDRTINALVKSISKFGFNQPIVVDKKNVIIKGHSRYMACKRLELKTIPCIISENTIAQNNADRLLDNKIHDLTRWNYDQLRVEMRDAESAINTILGKAEITDYTPVQVVKKVTDIVIDKAYNELIVKGSLNEQYYKIPCKCGYNLYLNVNLVK